MKKSTSMKSKPKFAKKKANSKQPDKKDTRTPAAKPAPELSKREVKVETTPPKEDAPPEVKIGGPTPEVAPCSPAVTQAGHHEVVQS